MIKEELYFDSRDNESKIHAIKWIPQEKPVCILQIVHGMAEYVDRYHAFAEFLAQQNILVVGEDHLGHGKSIGNYPKGYFCRRDPATVVVRDIHRLKKMIQEEYPGIPYFIFGHSMGSLITRNYISRYGMGIDGVIISATAMTPKSLLKVSGVLIKVLNFLQGPKHTSKFLDKMAFGNYCQKIENPVSEFDWLSKDSSQVEKYNEDPLCGFILTINGFKTLRELNMRLYDQENLNKIPKNLPVLFLYGSDDPVGDYGKAVKEVYDSYVQIGIENVMIKCYENDRHEILNETDKEMVMRDIYQWLEDECQAGGRL